MSYAQEFRAEWKPLVGASIGLGTGYAIFQYVTSIMAPYLLREFAWTKQAFAFVTTLSLVIIVFIMLTGRLVDVLGVRRTVAIGLVGLPITCILYTQMGGPIEQFYVIYLTQALLCVTMTTTVYSRVIVERFHKARGFALAIVASAPALTGFLGSGTLNEFVEANGWRAGYIAVATFSVVGTLIALTMVPAHTSPAVTRAPRRARQDYGVIFRHPAFWLMVIALLMCNLPQVIALSQLSLVLMDNGVSLQGLSARQFLGISMLAAFPLGTLVGRFACGLAMDRFPGHIVACICMAIPSIGLFLIASNLDSYLVLTIAVFLLGLLFGAEGDLVGYLVSRVFGVSIYGSVMGMLTAATSVSSAVGATLLMVILEKTDSYFYYILPCGFTVLFGSLLFLLLGRYMGKESEAAEPDVPIDVAASPATAG